jgi:hypothetical protein
MAGTRRIPLNRQHTPPVTEHAIRLFMQMQQHPWYSESWWQLEHQLRREVHARPWNFPCVEPEDAARYQTWEPNETAQALRQALEAGARELRRQQRQAKRNAQPDTTPPPS